MATDSPKNMISSSDDDSADEEGSSGRRRRFCIERVPEAAPPAVKVSSKRDRPNLDYDSSGYSRSTSKRRMTEAPPHLESRQEYRAPYQRSSSLQRHPHEHRLYQHPHSHQYQPPQPHFYPQSHPYPRHPHHPNPHLHLQHHPHQHHQYQQHQHEHHQHHQQQQQEQQQPHTSHHQHQHQQQKQHQPIGEPSNKERAEPLEVRKNPPRKPPQIKKPLGPTIFINPHMIKKFISKSMEFATSSANASAAHNKGSTPDAKGTQVLPTAPAADAIDKIDLKTSSKESLQAASTMAVIRLVTECIKNDNKRDEKLNKVLVARLIDQLTKHEEEDEEEEREVDTEQASSSGEPGRRMKYPEFHDERHDGISYYGSHKLGPGGQPIPVIGNRGGSSSGGVGSSSGQSGFSQTSSSSRSGHYPPANKQHGTHQQYRPRHVSSSDRRDPRYDENHTNKLRNYSR